MIWRTMTWKDGENEIDFSMDSDNGGAPMEVMEDFADADAYEEKLYKSGYMQRTPFFGDDTSCQVQDMEAYPRVLKKAAESDPRAVKICSILEWT